MDENNNNLLKPLLLKILATLAIFGGIFYIFYSVFSTDLLDTVEGQIEALRENNISKAYYDYTAEQFQETTNLASFHKFVTDHPTLSKNKYATFYHRTLKNGTGSLSGVLVAKDKTSANVKYTLIKEKRKWKILSISLKTLKDSDESDSDSVPEEVIGPINSQLNALKNHDITSAYHGYASNGFKNSTAYTDFDHFVKRNPIFSEYKQTKIQESTIYNDRALVSVILDSDKEILPVEYRLKKENGNWKILAIRVTKIPSDPDHLSTHSDFTGEQFTDDELVEVLDAHLSAIKKNNFKKAYSFTSKQFQKNNNLEIFTRFFIQNPTLIENQKAEFQRLMFNNNIATLRGYLTSKDGETTPVEYDLVLENNTWKISHIQIFPPSSDSKTMRENENKESSQLQFSKVHIGTKINLKGMILDPTSTITSPFAIIYVNLYIHNGDPKEQIAISLFDEKGNTTIPKIETNLTETGDTILSFLLSPPSSGWSFGKYQIKITSSSKVEKQVPFEIK